MIRNFQNGKFHPFIGLNNILLTFINISSSRWILIPTIALIVWEHSHPKLISTIPAKKFNSSFQVDPFSTLMSSRKAILTLKSSIKEVLFINNNLLAELKPFWMISIQIGPERSLLIMFLKPDRKSVSKFLMKIKVITTNLSVEL